MHGPACKGAAELGSEQVLLAASFAWRRGHGALNFLSSWDNQSFLFPPTILFTRDQESAETRKSARGAGNLRLGYYGKPRVPRETSGLPSVTVGWGMR